MREGGRKEKREERVFAATTIAEENPFSYGSVSSTPLTTFIKHVDHRSANYHGTNPTCHLSCAVQELKMILTSEVSFKSFQHL
jgi:hypothetical protein